MATVRTVYELIADALSLAGHYSPGEAIAAEDSDLALRLLQDLLAEWQGNGLLVPSLVTEAINLQVGKINYLVGQSAGMDLDTIRPDQIIGAYVRDSSSYDHPVNIIGERDYRRLAMKSTSSGRPTILWPNYTAPNMTIYVYPAPDVIESLYIQSIKPATDPSLLTQDMLTAVSIPRNYHNALRFNLALDLAPHYGVQLNPIVIMRAQRTKSAIISLNAARRVQAANLEVPKTRTGLYNASILTWGE